VPFFLYFASLMGLLMLSSPVGAKDLIVTGSRPNLIYIVDGNTDEVSKEIALEGPGSPATITFHPDGKRLFVVTNRWQEVAVVDIEAGAQTWRLVPGDENERLMFVGLAVHPEGKELFVYEVPTRREDDRFLVQPCRIRVVSTEDLQTLRSFEVPRQIGIIAFNPAGDILYASGHDIYFLNPQSGRIMKSLPLKHHSRTDMEDPDVFAFWPLHEQSKVLSSIYFAQDRITAANMAGLANLDLTTGSMEWMELEPTTQVLFTSVVSPSRRYAYLVYNTLTKVDLEKRRIEKRVTLDHTYYVVNISSDGRKIYLGGTQPDLSVYDAETLEPIKKIRLKGDQETSSLRVIRLPEPAKDETQQVSEPQ
jgi:quinohemoprotein amine dehydrogenase beta subunit